MVYEQMSSSPGELAAQSRSLLNILQLMSSQAVVPSRARFAGPGVGDAGNAHRVSLPGFKILSSQERPDAPNVAQRYRDTWVYVDDTDLQSKRIFALIMLLFTLADSAPDRAAPVITIPAQ